MVGSENINTIQGKKNYWGGYKNSNENVLFLGIQCPTSSHL